MERFTVDTRPYWDALQRKKLVIQQCGQCHAYRHYPQPMCPHCHSLDVSWREVEGTGTVHSWTVIHQTSIPRFSTQTPYAFITVDLPEEVRVAAPLRQVLYHDVRIGLPVKLVFEEAGGQAVNLAYVPA